jgi:putative heme iron utilization protein
VSNQPRPVTFPPDVVRAVTGHLNDDHAADMLLICRVYGGVPAATAARVVAVDGAGLDLVAMVAGQEHAVRVAFTAPADERADLRREVIRLHDAALAEVGA